MGFNWVAAGLTGVVVVVITLVVHSLAIAVHRHTDREPLRKMPYVAIILGMVLLPLQLLPVGSKSIQVLKPTPVYVGISTVVLSIGLLAVGTRTTGKDWRELLVVLWPGLALIPLYLLAPLIAGLPWMESFVRLQWQAVNQVTVTATLLLLVGSFSVTGYAGCAAVRTAPVALLPPLLAVGIRIATQATIGAGFDGLSVISYITFSPFLVPLGLLLYLVGFTITFPSSETTKP